MRKLRGPFKCNSSQSGLTLLVAVTLSDSNKNCAAVISLLLIHLGFPRLQPRSPNFLLHKHPFLRISWEIISPQVSVRAVSLLSHLNSGSGRNIAVLAAVNMLQIIIIIIIIHLCAVYLPLYTCNRPYFSGM